MCVWCLCTFIYIYKFFVIFAYRLKIRFCRFDMRKDFSVGRGCLVVIVVYVLLLFVLFSVWFCFSFFFFSFSFLKCTFAYDRAWPSWDYFFIIDRFYIALFSAPELTTLCGWQWREVKTQLLTNWIFFFFFFFFLYQIVTELSRWLLKCDIWNLGFMAVGLAVMLCFGGWNRRLSFCIFVSQTPFGRRLLASSIVRRLRLPKRKDKSGLKWRHETTSSSRKPIPFRIV